MSLYTLVLEYDGGTYISQIEAFDANAAVLKWAETFTVDGLHSNTASALAEGFRLDLSGESLEMIDGVENVWCATALVADKLALLNLIKTERF